MGFLTAIKRETNYVAALLRMLRAVKTVDAESNFGIADELEMRVDKYSDNLAFIEDEKEITYDDMELYANRVAAWALAEGCKVGDTVAVFVRNRAEYVPIWFGLSKVGVIPALLNYQLMGPALAHCLNISDAKLLILDHEMAEQWSAAKDDVKSKLKVFAAFGEVDKYPSFDLAISNQVPNRPDKSIRAKVKAGEQCMKMFTSGTTGLPKAAKVTHVRAQNYMRGFAAGANTGQKDRVLLVLPMYHATGGLCGVGAAISNGGAVIVRPKFSASNFWDEAVKYKATIFMYVGELCRFLLSSPSHPNEQEHNIRWMIGNGLRPEVWPGFVGRFNIPHVIEFYGATEGNVSLINIDGPVGAVGRVPNYLKFKFNCDIIKYDVETNTNLRGSDGYCLQTDDDEVGELIGEIRNDDPRFRFEGYETKEATQKKILRNVFKKNDAWFRTAALSKFGGITQANVYGVEVPGYDGRAGMGAIVAEETPDMKALKTHIEASLPHYARPVFLRLSKESDTTSTFKFKKTNLVKAGFDPANISEPIYFANPASGNYEKVTPSVFKKICSGETRL